MKTRHGSSLAVVILLTLGACTSGSEAADAPASSAPTSSHADATASNETDPRPAVQDIMGLDPFAPLEPGTYFIDPDGDPFTPLRVVYEIPFEGWSQWIGAAKFADDGHVGVSISTVTNLVRHGCRDHAWADPLVGPSVNDLAAALADLAPFRVTSSPRDATIDGYGGKHLQLTVPDLPVEGQGDDRRFAGCEEGTLKSWVAFIDTAEGDAFYGYTAPGHTEDFWILDVEGTRLMIEANRSPDPPRKAVGEMHAILDSIRIEP